ncbi:MAG: TIGR03619 family F420-dependent LLM class oxidoreductase [Dehalococcoidia bacterium]
MNFGIAVPPDPRVLNPLGGSGILQEMEDLGYDSAWIGDGVLMPKSIGARFGTGYEAITNLAFMAARTQKLKVGLSVLVLPQRNAIIAAKQIATIDVVSGGRVLLGVGVGWREGEFQALGVRERFKRRGAYTDDAIQALRALWSSTEPEYKGRYISVSDVYFGPKPAQGANIPIWIGGNSDAAIDRAARLGDVWHPMSLPVERIAEGTRRLRQKTREGRRVGVSLKIGIQVGTDLEVAVGSGVSKGEPEELVEEFKRYAEAGVDHAVINFGYDLEIARKQVRRFAEQCLPALAGTVSAGQ